MDEIQKALELIKHFRSEEKKEIAEDILTKLGEIFWKSPEKMAGDEEIVREISALVSSENKFESQSGVFLVVILIKKNLAGKLIDNGFGKEIAQKMAQSEDMVARLAGKNLLEFYLPDAVVRRGETVLQKGGRPDLG